MDRILSLIGKESNLQLLNNKEINAFNLNEFSSVKELRLFLLKNGGIYAWFDFGNGKIYIGSSKKLWTRFLSYKRYFFYKCESRINTKLANRIKKHGYKNIKFFILEIFNGDESKLRELENEYLNKYTPFGDLGYNIANYTIGYYFHGLKEEAIQKIKDANTGENSSNAVLNDEKIIEIKEMLCEGGKLKEIANKFGISTTVVSNIKRNLTWSHIRLSDELEAKLKKLCEKDKRKNFSRELVMEIKRDILSGLKMTEIARKHNVGYTAVSGLKYGNYYKDIIPLL